MSAAPKPLALIHALPAIGEYVEAEGGLFAGIAIGENGQPDAPLYVAIDILGPFEWQTACNAANAYTHAGHNDFRAPTPAESALCYANLKAEFPGKDGDPCWTNAQYSAHLAWVQGFYYGSQYSDFLKVIEYRVRPVRRSILQPFNPSDAPASVAGDSLAVAA